MNSFIQRKNNDLIEVTDTNCSLLQWGICVQSNLCIRVTPILSLITGGRLIQVVFKMGLTVKSNLCWRLLVLGHHSPGYITFLLVHGPIFLPLVVVFLVWFKYSNFCLQIYTFSTIAYQDINARFTSLMLLWIYIRYFWCGSEGQLMSAVRYIPRNTETRSTSHTIWIDKSQRDNVYWWYYFQWL